MKKIRQVLLCFLSVFTLGTVCNADMTSTLSKVTFLPNNNIIQNTSIDGLSITLNKPIPSFILPYYELPMNYDNFYTGEDYNENFVVSIIGVDVTFTNNTAQMLSIKSGQSNISIGDYSGILFLEGMTYANAGNPSATPDILIPPHQSIEKNIMISRYKLVGGTVMLRGILLPKSNNLTESLYLKIDMQDGSSQYISIISPSIGMVD